MGLILIASGAMPLAAQLATVATGTAIKTLLQVKLQPEIKGRIVEWGISFDGSAAATPIKVELIEADDFATVTAHVLADLHKLTDPNDGDPTTKVEVGTAASGYNSSNENSAPAAVRLLDCQLLPPTQPFLKQFPLGREPVLSPEMALRIRVTAGASVNAYCYVILEV